MATALLFRRASTASDQAIDAALATTGADSATRLAAREELNQLGYIWSPTGQLPPVVWLAGVPSLMAHILDRVVASGIYPENWSKLPAKVWSIPAHTM